MFDEKLAYTHQNPVQAVVVTKEGDWKYTNARGFFGMKGLITLCYSQYDVAQVGQAKAKPPCYHILHCKAFSNDESKVS